MNGRLAAFAALMCTIVLSACSTPRPYKYAIPAEAWDMFVSVDVWTRVDSEEIAILPAGFAAPVYNSSYDAMYGVGPALAGNLIAGLILEGANQRLAIWAEEDIQPLRAALGDFHLGPALQSDLNARLTELAWLKATSAKSTTSNDQTLEQTVAGSSASAVLWAPLRYYLTDRADRLVIEMWPFVSPASGDLKQLLAGNDAAEGLRPEQKDVLYRNRFFYYAAVEGATTDRVTNIAMWSKDGAAPLRAAMEHGSSVLAEMLVEDMTTLVDLSAEPPTAAVVIRSDDIGAWSRAVNGELTYLTRSAEKPLVSVPETERPGSKISKKPPPGTFY